MLKKHSSYTFNFSLQLLLPYSLTFGELSEEERVADMSYGVFSRAGFKIFLNRRCRMQKKHLLLFKWALRNEMKK